MVHVGDPRRFLALEAAMQDFDRTLAPYEQPRPVDRIVGLAYVCIPRGMAAGALATLPVLAELPGSEGVPTPVFALLRRLLRIDAEVERLALDLDAGHGAGGGGRRSCGGRRATRPAAERATSPPPSIHAVSRFSDRLPSRAHIRSVRPSCCEPACAHGRVSA